MRFAGAALLDHEEIGALGGWRQAKSARQDFGVTRNEIAVKLAVLPERLLHGRFLDRAAQVSADLLQGGNGLVVDRVEYEHRILG